MDTILIVDPDPVALEGLRTIVNSRPSCHILEARNESEAKTAARRSHPDLIVISHKPSQLDGAQVVQQVLSAASNLRVLFICGDNTMIQRAFEAGALGYLLKSHVEADLLPAIGQLMQGRTFFTAETIKLLRIRYHRNPYQGEHQTLTAREAGILQQIAEGKMNKDIATELGVSIRTVETHRAEIMKKLKLESLSELVRYAIRTGLIEP